MGLEVGLRDILTDGQTTGIGVLYHGHGRTVGKVPDRTPSRVRIHIVVITHGLGSTQLDCGGKSCPIQRIKV